MSANIMLRSANLIALAFLAFSSVAIAGADTQASSTGIQGAKLVTAAPALRQCPTDGSDPDCTPIQTNKPPVINWTAVLAANSYVLPTDTLTFAATSSDPDGTIAKTVFYIDDKVQATYASASFQTSVSSLAAGAHTVVAVAWDNKGTTGTTSRVPFTVRNSVVMGNIDGVSSDGVIGGWACSSYLPQSINVDLYLGGAAGTGVGIARFAANAASEAGVASACSASGSSYRFYITLTGEQRVQYGGKAIYVHGISPIGAPNNLLTNSGKFLVPAAVRDAQFVSQTVAPNMLAGGTQTVTVQMRNSGNYTWAAGTGFKLGSQNPQDNGTWTIARVSPVSDVAPGQTAVFTFNIKAPSSPGSYNFQWQMLQEGVVWFGSATPNVVINVLSGSISANPGTCTLPVGSSTCSSVITWTSNNGASEVWGSNPDGSSSKLIGSGQSGSQTASGIGTGGYRFVLKNSGFTLASVDTRAVPAPVVASTVSMEYDELGRLITLRDSAGQVKATYQYDANSNLTATTDALNHVTSSNYDALDRVTSSTDAASHTIYYSYDVSDRITKVVDPRGNATTYDYDGFGQLWRQVSPDSGVTLFTYDTGGLLQSMTRADGATSQYGYDGLNRLITIGAGGLYQRFGYDGCTNGAGRLCSASDDFSTVSYSYTPEGDIAGRGFSVAGTTYGLGYGYDGLGRLVSLVYPDGNRVNYAYNNGSVSGATLTSSGITSSIASNVTYAPGDHLLSSWTSSNGLINSLTYDVDGRLSSISVPGVQSLTFTHDGADRLTRITNGMDAALTQSAEYDDASRLLSITSPADNESYEYDSNGNRKSQVVNGVSSFNGIGATDNRLNSAGANTFGYDANGNLTTILGATHYHYDAFNRMDFAEGIPLYVNPEGQRLRKAGPSGTSYFAPDRSGLMLADYANGSWVDYVWLNGRVVGRISSGQSFAVHSDQLGRPESITDASRSTVWLAHNFAFDREVVASNFDFNLGFPGQYYDKELHLWNNGYRDYRSDLGRYIETDPIGLVGGPNTYAYVSGNPFSAVDVLGLCKCSKSGTAPDPSVYDQLGKRANNVIVARDPYGMGAAAGEFYNGITLSKFRRGGQLDAQVRYGAEPPYANYVFGVYMSASGASLSQALMAAQDYARYAGAPQVYRNAHRTMDKNYPDIPASNVENITAGYNDQKNGTLCTVQ